MKNPAGVCVDTLSPLCGMAFFPGSAGRQRRPRRRRKCCQNLQSRSSTKFAAQWCVPCTCGAACACICVSVSVSVSVRVSVHVPSWTCLFPFMFHPPPSTVHVTLSGLRCSEATEPVPCKHAVERAATAKPSAPSALERCCCCCCHDHNHERKNRRPATSGASARRSDKRRGSGE